MDGFLFHSEQVFPPGECLHFLLVLPGASGAVHSVRVMCLKGAAEVVRVSASTAGPAFGIGCRMTNYSVLLNPDLSSDERVLTAVSAEKPAGASLPSSAGWLRFAAHRR